MTNAEKLTKQIAGTMALEGMRLNSNELAVIKECADGTRSSAKEIQSLIDKYTVK